MAYIEIENLIIKDTTINISFFDREVIGIYSDVIQEKIFVDESESVSKKVRTENTLALLQMSSERPLLGYGIGSKEFFERSIVLN